MQSSIKVLIVDDNAPFRRLIAAFVTHAGFSSAEAADGLQALELVKTENPSIILLDLQMQPMGGFAFMEEHVKRGHPCPVVLVTGETETDILSRATQLGFAGVLTKPVSQSRIIQMIERSTGLQPIT